MVRPGLIGVVLALCGCHLLEGYQADDSDDGAAAVDADAITRPDVDHHVDGLVDAKSPCDDDLPCTEDRQSGGGCSHELVAGYCLLDQRCLADGETDPANSCHYCDAKTNSMAVLEDEARCDDNDPCSYADACKAGVCAGAKYSCPNGLACSTAVCNGVASAPGGCGVAAGFCLVADVCQAALDGADACHLCDPAFSVYSWAPGSGCVVTFVGDGSNDTVDGPAYAARFSQGRAIATDAQGTIYVAEEDGHVVRRIADGIVTTIAGCT